MKFLSGKTLRPRPISTRKGNSMGPVGMFLFSSVFVILGLGLFVGLTVSPTWRWYQAQGWEAVECTILSSEVRTHRGSDSTTYSVAITYRYDYPPGESNAHSYTSDQVDFSSGSSSGRQAKADIVAQYPEGSPATAYVDPQAPENAVLLREFRLGYLIGLLGLVFTAVGIGVFLFGHTGAGVGALSRQISRTEGDYTFNSQSIELHPTQGRLKSFVVFLIFALVWNGIILLVSFAHWRDGGFPGFTVFAFLSIFMLIGLGLLAYVVYCFLALFNPHPHLTLTPGTLPLGQAATLTWRFDRSVDRIQQLKVYLVGTESAKYRQGTKTHTAQNEFEKILVFETQDAREMMQGELQLAVPEFTMHSFTAPNNNVQWTLQFNGDIAFWPDIKDSFTVQIVPMEAARA